MHSQMNRRGRQVVVWPLVVVCAALFGGAPLSCGGGDSADSQGTAGQAGSDGGVGGSGATSSGGTGAANGSGGGAGEAGAGGTGAAGGEAGAAGAAGDAGAAGEAGSAGVGGSAGDAGQGRGGGAGSAGAAGPECGDGIVEPPEACDDNGVDPDDGCSPDCEIESGWDCDDGSPTTCEPICGDDMLVPSEACDGDLLSSDCESLGFSGGVLACDACEFDTSGCTTCGDDVCEPGELTDCPVDCDVVGVSAGQDHTCAVAGTGSAWCWGDNTSGKLGDGSTDPSNSPVTVDALAGVVDVSAGFGVHSCAVLGTGAVWCWGDNAWGQLGDGTYTESLAPVQVAGVADAEKVCAGVDHTCALLASGRVACWGSNEHGQLGHQGTYESCNGTDCSADAVLVDYMLSTVQMDCGRHHTCVLKDDGEVFCWGRNGYGQLGVGDTSSRSTPDRVLGIPTAASMSAGLESACAVMETGSAWCWGKNDAGQLGGGSASAHEVSALEVDGLSNAARIGPGLDHTCVLLDDGSAWCWGADGSGQLGNGASGASWTLQAVEPPADTAAIVDAGAMHTCAVKHDGTLWCWGGNDAGQLGTGTNDPAEIPQSLELQ